LKKNPFIKILFFAVIIFIATKLNAQHIGIGTTTPNAAALLDITSTNKGFLTPRMTIAQRNAISNPAIGLVIWCSDCDELQVYNGFMWTNMSGAAASIKTEPALQICYRTWSYKNLTIRTYRNGDSIPVVTDPTAWSNLTTGAMCWFNNDSTANDSIYGALYNWYAINDSRGFAPQGWHMPSNGEFNLISNCLGGNAVAGGKMKTVSTLWTIPNTGATNTSGFNGLPGGLRNSNGLFSSLHTNGNWWSKTESNTNNAWYSFLQYQNASLSSVVISKNTGFSIRLIKD
jgi:uncharacterized protein (TIGR02145 family)